MRQIKFRAWNTKTNEMFSPEEMAEDQLTLLPTGFFINVSSIDTRLSIVYPLEAMIPMQFTGLTDKNGKEIYEGDIVITDRFPKGGWSDPRIVVWSSGGFALNDAPSGKLAGGHWIEVIGNIYENKELLS